MIHVNLQQIPLNINFLFISVKRFCGQDKQEQVVITHLSIERKRERELSSNFNLKAIGWGGGGFNWNVLSISSKVKD